MGSSNIASAGQMQTASQRIKKDADYVFYELTRSICPKCRRVIDAQVILRANRVYMRKRCPQCGPFEALVYADAEAYTTFGKYNKPGTIPLVNSSEIHDGCPYDCGLCPDHQQHTCLGIIEVNSVCNMECPLPSLVSQSAQSDACIFECRRRTATPSSGHSLRRAYSATVIDVQEPRAARRKSYGVGPASVPPAAIGSSAWKRCRPTSISCANPRASPRTTT